MADYTYSETFQEGEDTTEYRLLTRDFVSESEFEGQKILKVDPKGLEFLAHAAFSDVSFFLRSAHLQSLKTGLEDPEASDNDRFVLYTLLQNACVAAHGQLPSCQDTGTAIIMGKKGDRSGPAPTTRQRSLRASSQLSRKRICGIHKLPR